MVWVSDEMTVDAIITGSITNGKKRCTIQLSPSKEVESIFSEAARDFQCQSEEINFVLQINDNLVSSFFLFYYLKVCFLRYVLF